LGVQDEARNRREAREMNNNLLMVFMDLKRIIASPFLEKKKTHLGVFNSSTWTRTRNLAGLYSSHIEVHFECSKLLYLLTALLSARQAVNHPNAQDVVGRGWLTRRIFENKGVSL
jgi:hypothetical protein